jgi:hypothetical protein
MALLSATNETISFTLPNQSVIFRESYEFSVLNQIKANEGKNTNFYHNARVIIYKD